MDFLKPETICDFYVDEDRKLLWKIEMDMLLAVKEICKKHEIKYFLHSGSALGAVRHQGFIPWDDDLDLGMLRDDFDKFLLFAEQELPSNMFLQYGLNDGGHICGLIRIRDKNSTGIIKIDKDKDCNNGVYIEIYPFDSVPENPIQAKLQYFKSLVLYHGLLAEYYGPFSKKQIALRMLVRILGVKRSYEMWQSVCKKYNDKPTKYVNTVALPDYVKEGIYLLKREWIEETIESKYEYTTVSLPSGVKEMLSLNYGDYMKLPPVEERGILHSKTVFFDPNKPYTFYKGSKIIDEYFSK